MAYALRNREVFEAEVNGKTYTFTCYTQSTSYGFRHICTEGYNNTTECRWVKGDIVAKATYYNRTWERFRYETVLDRGIEAVSPDKETAQALRDILIEKKSEADRIKCEQQIAQFKALYDQTSDTCKETLSKMTVQDESDMNLVQGIMALDVIFNGVRD